MADLNKAVADLLARLDAVNGRLQKVESQLASGASSSGAASSSSSSSSGADSAAVTLFDDLVNDHLKPWEQLTQQIGSDRLKNQTADFLTAVAGLRNVVATASQSKKPADVSKVPVVASFLEASNRVVAAKSGPRKGDADFNHVSALSEAVAGLSWFFWAKGDPVMDRVPAGVVKDGLDGAVFYLNPILVAHKPGAAQENPDQIKWVNLLKAFFNELQAYVQKNHTTSLAWNPNGGDAAAAAPAPSPSPAAGGAPAPPPPGPPPAPSPADEKVAAAAQARSGLFAALNKGDSMNSASSAFGLKKVTKDMQTHKNPELRAGGVVKSVEPKAPVARAASSAPAARVRPPVTELQGNKWVVEWHKDNKNIVINETEPKHVLYCYKLEGCVVHVTDPKINAITIDNCKKTAVVFHTVISGVEIVNSVSMEVQAQGVVPNFAIDKCSSITVYVPQESLESQFVVSKSDAINVIIPDGSAGDVKELYVPEQFVSKIVNGSLVTTTLEHE